MNSKTNHLFRSGLSLLLALCLILSTPIAALAAVEEVSTCPAAQAVHEAKFYGEKAKLVVDLINEKILGDSTLALGVKLMDDESLTSTIRGMMDDAEYKDMLESVMVDFGMEVTSENKDKLAAELTAVIRLCEKGKNDEAMVEVIRFALVELEGVSTADAPKMAELYYKLYKTTDDAAALNTAAAAFGHKPEKVAEVAATCEKTGTKEHYKCDCGKLYADAEGKTEVTMDTLATTVAPHTAEAVAEVPAACGKPGTKAHFACSVCGKLFTDAEAKTEVTKEELATTVTVHTTKAVDEVPAVCGTPGTKAHYTCDCGKLFSDAEGKTEVTAESLKTIADVHTPKEVAEVPATCVKTGTKAHYACGCGLQFSDAEGKTQVTAEELVIPAAGTHDTKEVAEVPATCDKAGMKAHTACSACGMLFDAEGKEVTAESLVIPTTGHSYEASAWMWAEDYSAASVSLICSACDLAPKVVTATVTSSSTEGDCETAVTTTYTATAEHEGKTFTDTKSVTGINPDGHKYGDTIWTWNEALTEAKASKTCSVCEKSIEAKGQITTVVNTEATCTEDGKATLTAKAVLNGTEYISEKTKVLPAGHTYKDGICTVCGEKEISVFRISGKTRYQTSIKTADTLKAVLNVEKFANIIVASGNNFADALSGSYLATVKNAPILLVDSATATLVQDYIKANLAENGTVYILGGGAAVAETFEKGLPETMNVKRLKGSNRYATNLEILKEAGVGKEDILICTGNNFADSLSASALAKPILLVDSALNADQKAFLEALGKNNKLFVLGGTGAISADLANVISTYGSTQRIGGKTRFETSVLLADRFLEAPTMAVLAYAYNYPDGLCGGPLAHALGAPLILTQTDSEAAATAFAKEYKISSGYVLGGEILISDAAAQTIFGLDSSVPIVKK